VKRTLLLLIAAALLAPASQARVTGGTPVALVTAETLDQLIALDLPSGRVIKRLEMPADPENVEAYGSNAVVVSARAGAVTLLAPSSLRVRKVIRGFGAPHLAAFAADLKHLYVTDDARGQLVVIDLERARVIRKIFVGYGAHHLSVSNDGNRVWLALGEQAHTLVVLDTTATTRPRILGRIHLPWAAHDLAFTPNSRRVWVTSDDRPQVAVYDAATMHQLFTIRAGRPPQHVAFGRFAFVTSGYGNELRVFTLNGSLRSTVKIAHGSFNVAVSGDLVLTSSLLDGSVTEVDGTPGRVLLHERIAPAARDAAIYTLP
jgi:DNA-binding beta-propeller fold protein YncE